MKIYNFKLEKPDGNTEVVQVDTKNLGIDEQNLDTEACGLGQAMLEYGELHARCRTQLQRKEELLSVKGQAESNNRISSLMRRLDGSKWFESPNLTMVKKAAEEEGTRSNSFDLTVKRHIEKKAQEG